MITFLAHMLDAERRGIPVQSVVHQVKNFTSEGPQIFRGVSNVAGTQTLDKVVENVFAAPHGFETQRPWALDDAPIGLTICLHVVLAL